MIKKWERGENTPEGWPGRGDLMVLKAFANTREGKKKLKKAIKNFQALLAAKNLDEARTILKSVYAKLDKAAKKRIIHSNTASRKKSRLTRKLSAAAKPA